jgi:hypothetical protein
VYNGAGKVPPAPLSATTGVEAVVVGADVVVVVEVVVEVVVADVEVVVVEVVWRGAKVAVVVVEIAWVVDVGWVVVVEVVVALLQAVKTIAVVNSNDVRTMSHFLLNLFNNFPFSFFLFSFIIKCYL